MGSSEATEPDDTGVYYSHADLAGFFRRLVVVVVDFTIVLVMWMLLLLLSVPLGATTPLPASVVAFGLAWAYMVLLKAGPNGTLGYRLANVRLVNVQGRPAGLLVSSYRFLLLFVGPLHLVFDLLWLTTDANRQTLRDKLTATYVVRRGAQPLARARFAHPTYFIATLAFALPDVRRPQP
jgi:uncharacterized RDD family membrane protein YckC